MAAPRVIVFGPTGGAASSAAITAHKLGAHVALAMRDKTKAIPGLSSSEESSGNFTRVTADLTDAASVANAVSQTGAKTAFIYLMFGSTDGMRGTIEALKSSGIELVVFLSSFTIEGPIREVKPADLIPFLHARVEANLEDVFGAGNYVALRGGSFAPNNKTYVEEIYKGHVKVLFPDATMDCIVPEDIGRVAGTVLVKGVPEDGKTVLYILGPELRTQHEAVKILAEMFGKTPKLEPATHEEARKVLLEVRKIPKPLVDYMTSHTDRHSASVGQKTIYGTPIEDSWLRNVEKYSGYKPTTFQQWVEANRSELMSTVSEQTEAWREATSAAS